MRRIQSPFIGRMSRKNFIWVQLFMLLLLVLIFIVVLQGNLSLENIYAQYNTLQYILLFLIPFNLALQFITSFRRLHDIEQSGLWALLLFSSLLLIPLLDMALLIYLSYKKGTPTSNRYGEPDTRPLLDSILNAVPYPYEHQNIDASTKT